MTSAAAIALGISMAWGAVAQPAEVALSAGAAGGAHDAAQPGATTRSGQGAARRQMDAPVSEDEIRAHIAYLASDALGGRMPGTAGETLAAHYIARELAAAGFVGGAGDEAAGAGGAGDGAGGQWYQPVPLVELGGADGTARFTLANGAAVAVDGTLLRAPAGQADIDDAPMVYVGFGVDGAGHVVADVRGKIALLLIVDRAGDGAMGLQARREAVVQAGARGVLLVPSAAMPIDALRRSFTTPRPQLESRISRAQAEGLLTAQGADALLIAAMVDPASARAAANADDFAGQMLNVRATLHATSTRRTYASYNVIGRLPGTRPGSGTVLLMGHYDHIGLCGPAGDADRICNGAVDNASGIAVLLATAKRLGRGPRADRDIVIMATTAEEQGLLGAYQYAHAPTVPLQSIVVALNLDTVAIAPRGAPMALVGRGSTPLEAEVDAVARTLGRAIDMDQEANAFIRRQDGWALALGGVPAIMAGGSFSDMDRLEAFLNGPYHGPDD
ncbi:MAG: M28 family peptidase, partial [Sphingopyxis sp.]